MRKPNFFLNRFLSLLGLVAAVGGIVGLAIAPSEMAVANVLCIVCCALIAAKEVKDLVANHRMENLYYEFLRKKMQEGKENMDDRNL